jgi:hypothetical protein
MIWFHVRNTLYESAFTAFVSWSSFGRNSAANRPMPIVRHFMESSWSKPDFRPQIVYDDLNYSWFSSRRQCECPCIPLNKLLHIPSHSLPVFLPLRVGWVYKLRGIVTDYRQTPDSIPSRVFWLTLFVVFSVFQVNAILIFFKVYPSY